MSRTIVVPVDGSENAIRALGHAIEIARGVGARLVLVNVQPDLRNAPNVKKFFSEEQVLEYERELAEEALEEAVRIAGESSLPYETSIRMGSPAEEICREAKEREAMGIVMGTRGLGPIRRAILGSVSYGVLHGAPCPVTLVP